MCGLQIQERLTPRWLSKGIDSGRFCEHGYDDIIGSSLGSFCTTKRFEDDHTYLCARGQGVQVDKAIPWFRHAYSIRSTNNKSKKDPGANPFRPRLNPPLAQEPNPLHMIPNTGHKTPTIQTATLIIEAQNHRAVRAHPCMYTHTYIHTY